MEDLIGKVFGKLKVIGYAGDYARGGLWRCKCECGNETVVRRSVLKRNFTKDCWCLCYNGEAKDTADIGIVGKHFGHLEVLAIDKIKKSEIDWLCRCDCGNEAIVSHIDLMNGKAQNCGCAGKNQGQGQVTLLHGDSKTKLYRKWNSIKRGPKIGICDEWKDYVAFREWSLANGYVEGESMYLRRKDTDGEFSPSNCDWVPYNGDILEGYAGVEPIKMTHNGLTLTLTEWIQLLNVEQKMFYRRVYRSGRDIAKACEKPIKGRVIDLDAIVEAEKKRLENNS